MMKKFAQRLLAGSLAAVMFACALPAIPARAERVYNEVLPYNLEEQEEKWLKSEQADTYESGAVTFPLNGVSVNMGEELVYHLFRQGNTEAKQKVTLAVLDLTAGYGEDYEILADGETVFGQANRILDGSGVTYDVYPGTNVMKDADGQEDAAAELKDKDKEEIRETASAVFDLEFETGEQEKEIRIRAGVPEKAVGNKELQQIGRAHV